MDLWFRLQEVKTTLTSIISTLKLITYISYSILIHLFKLNMMIFVMHLILVFFL